MHMGTLEGTCNFFGHVNSWWPKGTSGRAPKNESESQLPCVAAASSNPLEMHAHASSYNYVRRFVLVIKLHMHSYTPQKTEGVKFAPLGPHEGVRADPLSLCEGVRLLTPSG